MGNKPDSITFVTENNEEVIFEVIEQTRLGGIDYLLVCATDGSDEALILKDVSVDTDPEAVYEVVEDEKELAAALDIFKELIDDIELN